MLLRTIVSDPYGCYFLAHGSGTRCLTKAIQRSVPYRDQAISWEMFYLEQALVSVYHRKRLRNW